jgi:hypothetical protein
MKQYCASKVVCIYELPLQSMHACRLESVTNPTQQHPLGMVGVPSCQGMELTKALAGERHERLTSNMGIGNFGHSQSGSIER